MKKISKNNILLLGGITAFILVVIGAQSFWAQARFSNQYFFEPQKKSSSSSHLYYEVREEKLNEKAGEYSPWYFQNQENLTIPYCRQFEHRLDRKYCINAYKSQKKREDRKKEIQKNLEKRERKYWNRGNIQEEKNLEEKELTPTDELKTCLKIRNDKRRKECLEERKEKMDKNYEREEKQRKEERKYIFW